MKTPHKSNLFHFLPTKCVAYTSGPENPNLVFWYWLWFALEAPPVIGYQKPSVFCESYRKGRLIAFKDRWKRFKMLRLGLTETEYQTVRSKIKTLANKFKKQLLNAWEENDLDFYQSLVRSGIRGKRHGKES